MAFVRGLVRSILLVTLGGLIWTGGASAAEGLAINGQAIPAIKLEAVVAARLSNGQKDDAQTRTQAREELIRHEALLQAALKAGVDTPLLQAQGQYAAETLKVRAYLQQWLKQNPISKEAVTKEYEALKARSGTQEVQLRQILLVSEDDAKKVLTQLAAGGKFEDLAQLASRDAATRTHGGLLPWIPSGLLQPAIAQEVSKLAKGQMGAKPVQTPAGFHVIRLEGSRPFSLPPLDELQAQIVRNLENQAVDAHARQLREQAQVK